MLGFFAAFAVKLPVVPLHTWLPDAHTEAPTAGSVILAGLVLKTGAYGMLRFAVPLFPEAAAALAPSPWRWGSSASSTARCWPSARRDLKRLVAYTSVSHMGFVLLGIFAVERAGAPRRRGRDARHGVSTGALFILVGALQERIHTRDMDRMGGLWATAPRLGGIHALLRSPRWACPGWATSSASFWCCWALTASARRSPPSRRWAWWLAVSTRCGWSSASSTGRTREGWKFADLSARETAIAAALIAARALARPVSRAAPARGRAGAAAALPHDAE